MKRLLIATLALMCAGWIGAADIQIATADIQSVMEGYYKAQEAARQLKQKRVSFLEELQGLKLEGQKLVDRAEELRDRSGLRALSESERNKTQQEFQSKLVELRQFEIRYDDFRAQREAELETYARSTQRRIMEDVAAATRAVGEQNGFNLILNSNKSNLLASDVLFSREVDDVTAKILGVLNATQPRKEPMPAPRDRG